MDQKLMKFCPRCFFKNAVSLYETLKRNTFLYLAVFELCSDIKVDEQFSCKLHWWEAHEMFQCFGCGLWWQMMICCIKDYSSCTCLSFLSSSWVFKEFCTFSMHFFKAGQVVLLSNAALWCFESACTGPVQKHKFTVIYASFLFGLSFCCEKLWN